MKAQSIEYVACYSDQYAGWCVFKKKHWALFIEYHAGAFREPATARSEAKRLNDLEKAK